jgi:hypothetical protein
MNQIEAENKYSRRNIRQLVKKEVKNNKELLDWFLGFGFRYSQYLSQDTYPSKRKRIETLQQKSLYQISVAVASAVLRSKENQTLQKVVGWLMGEMPHENIWDKVKTAAELVAIGRGLGIYKIVKNKYKEAEVVPLFQLSDALHAHINDTEVNPPLIEPPKQVEDNSSCGYHSIKEPVLSGGNIKYHDENLGLDVINILNQTPLRINQEIFKQEPKMPEGFDEDQKTAYIKAYKAATKLITSNNNKFWLAWQYDSRGRIYSHGWGVNFQSFEWAKALIDLHKKEKICSNLPATSTSK